VSATTAVGVTLAIHLVLFVPVVLAGLVVLWSADVSLGVLWTRPTDEAPSAMQNQVP
jgi:hypothetical protein